MTKFEDGNVVKFKNGPQVENLWGDKVTLEYFLISSDQSKTDVGEVAIYSHPYTMVIRESELELVAEDEYSDFPNDFTPGWEWWNSLDEEYTDELIGPCWLEYLGR